MSIVCNILMISLELLFQHKIFSNFLLINATDRSKISSDQSAHFSPYAYTPFNFSRTLSLMFTKWCHYVFKNDEIFFYFQKPGMFSGTDNTIQWSVLISIQWRWLFYLRFWFLTMFYFSNYKFTIVKKDKLLTDSFSLFQCTFIFIHTVWKLGRNQHLNRRSFSLFWNLQRRLYEKSQVKWCF